MKYIATTVSVLLFSLVLMGSGIVPAPGAPINSPSFTGQVAVPAGTAAAPSQTTPGDTDTGIYYPAANTVGVSAGGSQKLSVSATEITATGADLKLATASKAAEFTGALANYKLSATTDVTNGFQFFSLQNQNAGSQSATTQTVLSLFSKDGAGLTDLEIFLVGKGSPTDVTNSHGLDFGFYSPTSGGPFYVIDSFALGAEAAKDIKMGFNFDPQALILRAASGDVALNQGDLRIEVVGKGLRVKTGTNAKIGQATLVAGTVTVANTSVNANSRIFLEVSAAGGTQGFLRTTKSAGVSFTITSTSATETSTVDWFIVQSIP